MRFDDRLRLRVCSALLQTVADKNCEKIHYMAPNIYCCGAGTAADTEQVTAMTSSQLELLRLQTKRQTRVVNAMTQLKRHLFKYQGHVGAYLVLGGVDADGPHLHTIWAAGSTDTLPYVTMGSGSLAAMAMMESDYKDDMSEVEAIALVKRAIQAGIFNDLGSGSNVDVCVIRQVGGTASDGAGASSSAAAAAAASSSSASTAAADSGLDETEIAEAVACPAILASSGAEMPFDTPVNVGKGVQAIYKRGYETATNDAAAFRARVVPVAAKTIPRGATDVVAKLFRECVVVETVASGDGDVDM